MIRWSGAAKVASAVGLIATTMIVYLVLRRDQDCDRSTSESASHAAIFVGGIVFAIAAYTFTPARWSVASRLGLSILIGGSAMFCFYLLFGLTWVEKCST
jgi:hypothetical protein